MPSLPRWRYLQHWNRTSTPSQNVSSLTARVCQIEAHAPSVSCSSGSANSWNLHERGDGSPATGSLAPMAPGLRIRELTHGRIKMMTALCPAWSHTFQTMCLGFQSHQVMPQAFRLPKPSFFLLKRSYLLAELLPDWLVLSSPAGDSSQMVASSATSMAHYWPAG